MVRLISIAKCWNCELWISKDEIFCKNRSAYNLIEIDENFKEITPINTLKGLLRWTRLPFGIKTLSHIFQKLIENVLFGNMYHYIGLVSRVFTYGPGDQGSVPGHVIPKT